MTGVSGSGKSSLAFDTLYAEGQRRYAESLSTYARQFLERLDRPDVDSIEPVPPAIALEQKNGVRNARSTVGHADGDPRLAAAALRARRDDVLPGLRRRGRAREAWTARSRSSASRRRARAPSSWRRSPGRTRARRRRPAASAAPSDAARLSEYKRAGFFRALAPRRRDRRDRRDVEGLLDAEGRLRARRRPLRRRRGVAARARVRGGDRLRARRAPRGPHRRTASARFAAASTARSCGREFRDPTPPLFAFNSPLGACPACQGFGRVIGVDLEKAIPDRSLDAVGAAGRAVEHAGVRVGLRRPLPRLPPLLRADRRAGRAPLGARARGADPTGAATSTASSGFFDWLETKRYKIHVRVLLARYRAYTLCEDCRGARLAPPALLGPVSRARRSPSSRTCRSRDLKRFLDELCALGAGGGAARPRSSRSCARACAT